MIITETHNDFNLVEFYQIHNLRFKIANRRIDISYMHLAVGRLGLTFFSQ